MRVDFKKGKLYLPLSYIYQRQEAAYNLQLSISDKDRPCQDVAGHTYWVVTSVSMKHLRRSINNDNLIKENYIYSFNKN